MDVVVVLAPEVGEQKGVVLELLVHDEAGVTGVIHDVGLGSLDSEQDVPEVLRRVADETLGTVETGGGQEGVATGTLDLLLVSLPETLGTLTVEQVVVL